MLVSSYSDPDRAKFQIIITIQQNLPECLPVGLVASWVVELYTVHGKSHDWNYLCPLQSLLSCQLLTYL